ncbi:MAG: substrate-binding domain-containing protein [Burkholderiales bacterium]
MTNCRHSLRTRLQVLALALLSLVEVPHALGQQSAGAAGVHTKLTIGGSFLLVPIMTDMARRFEGLNPGVRIDVQSSGTGKGLADVRSGVSDIAMAPRALREAERDLFGFPIARDGVAVIVNTANPVRGISSSQLTDILVGRIFNWTALNGLDAPVKLAWRQGEGSTEFILEHLKLRRAQIGPHTAIVTNDDAIKFVANTPDGIALASVGLSERSARERTPIRLLAYNGFPAASRTIQNHVYSLSRPLTLITRRPPEGVQKQFIDFATSKRVVDLQLKYGFVPYEE